MEHWENNGLMIKSTTYTDEDLVVKFEIYPTGNSSAQTWILRVVNLQEDRVVKTRNEFMRVYNDHFLLWKFTDDEAELYINGAAESAEILAANFYALHQEVFGEWLCVEAFIGSSLEKCRSKQALFAKGPKRLLEYYADWLRKYGRNPYFLEFEGLTNANALANRIPLKLLTFGECYFIGQDFIFSKVAT